MAWQTHLPDQYDPDAARQLMTEAGYSASKPLHVTVATSASGSGRCSPCR